MAKSTLLFLSFMLVSFMILSFLTFMTASAAYGMPPRHEPDFEHLAEEIQISDEQMESFLSIMHEQHENRKSIHDEGRENIKDRMEQLDDELVNRLSGILTEQQLQAFVERLEKRKRERKKHRLLNTHRAGCCQQ